MAVRSIRTPAANRIKGEKLANLPVQATVKVERVVNLKTVMAIGRTIPRRSWSAPEQSSLMAEWDRSTRSMWDGLQIIKQVIDASVSFRVLDRNLIGVSMPMGRGFMA